MGCVFHRWRIQYFFCPISVVPSRVSLQKTLIKIPINFSIIIISLLIFTRHIQMLICLDFIFTLGNWATHFIQSTRPFLHKVNRIRLIVKERRQASNVCLQVFCRSRIIIVKNKKQKESNDSSSNLLETN